jgi:alkylresorcinol/alkylpyrone synthase
VTVDSIRLLGLATALPAHRLPQGVARAAAAELFRDDFRDLERRLTLFDHAGIDERALCQPPDWYLQPSSFAERNALFVRHAEDLLLDAGRRALADACLAPEDIDAVVTVCSTGIATPSLEARIADRLGLRADCERTPVFGLGCVGGVLGLARAAQIARGRAGGRVLLLAVELCSLTLRRSDRTTANLVACALFGDGAAAAVVGPGELGPRLGPAGEHRWPDSLRVMGWDVEDDGLSVVFSIEIPGLARTRLRAATDAFLERHELTLADIDAFVCHPGGAKVVEALESAYELPPEALADTRAVLRTHGNMSSVTVLFVLAARLARAGFGRGLLTALGPGFTAGFVLLEDAP